MKLVSDQPRILQSRLGAFAFGVSFLLVGLAFIFSSAFTYLLVSQGFVAYARTISTLSSFGFTLAWSLIAVLGVSGGILSLAGAWFLRGSFSSPRRRTRAARIAGLLAPALACAFLVGSAFAQPAFAAIGSNQTAVLNQTACSPVATASYVIQTDGTHYYAFDSNTCALAYGGPNNEGGVTGTNASAVIESTVSGLGSAGGTIVVQTGSYSFTHQTKIRITSSLTNGFSFTCASSAEASQYPSNVFSGGCLFTDTEPAANHYAFVFSFVNGVTAGFSLDGIRFVSDNTNGTQIITPTTSGTISLNIGSIMVTTLGGTYGSAFSLVAPDEPPNTAIGQIGTIVGQVQNAEAVAVSIEGFDNGQIGFIEGYAGHSSPFDTVYIHDGQDVTIGSIQTNGDGTQTGASMHLDDVLDMNVLSCDLEDTAGDLILMSGASNGVYVQCAHVNAGSGTITTGIDLGNSYNARVFIASIGAHSGSTTAVSDTNCNGCFVQITSNPSGFAAYCNQPNYGTILLIGNAATPAAALSPSSSPWTYQNTYCMPAIVTVSAFAGTISEVQLKQRISDSFQTTTIFSGVNLSTFTWPSLAPYNELVFTYTGSLKANATLTY